MADVSYEAPKVEVLGSVRALTLGDCLSLDDGMAGGGTTPIASSDLCLPD